jgi:tetratricopeptide (TPR) repeat protein
MYLDYVANKTRLGPRPFFQERADKMSRSTTTELITRSLEAVAKRYDLVSRREFELFTECGSPKRFVDVAWLTPGSATHRSRPVFFFEIDQKAEGVMWNRLKIGADLLSLDLLPVSAVAAVRGRAHQETVSERVLNSFQVPPRFVQSLKLPPEVITTSASCQAELEKWFETFVPLCAPPGEGSVAEISKAYQPMLRGGNIALASAHLDAHAELLWYLIDNGHLKDRERAAILSIARARLLQRIGQHDCARSCLQRLGQRIVDWSELSANSAGVRGVVTTLSADMRYGSGDSIDVLTNAQQNLLEPYHRAQIFWRIGLAHLARGELPEAQRVFNQYEETTAAFSTSQANVHLLKALTELNRPNGGPLEHALKYATAEMNLLANDPEGTFHGAIASIYLMLLAADHEGRTVDSQRCTELTNLALEVGVSADADGLREIITATPGPNPPLSIAGSRAALIEKGNIVELAGHTYAERLNKIFSAVCYYTLCKAP